MAINNTFNTNSVITEDWNGGYKLELGLTAEANADNWTVDFQLPYTIDQAYGADIVDNGNGNYTISGQNNQASLDRGQSINSVFIIEDYGQEAVMPQIDSSITTSFQPIEESTTEESTADNAIQPENGRNILDVDSNFGGDPSKVRSLRQTTVM